VQPPLTQAERDRIRELHTQGRSRNAIAAELGRGVASISRAAKDMGLSFDRRATQAATAAKVIDAKAKRVAEMNALLDDAKRLRLQLFAPCTIHAFGGKENTYNQAQIEQPLFADQAKIMQAYGTAIEKSLRLDAHDGDGSIEQVGSLLGNLFDSIRGRVGEDQAAADDDA
jgi:hypothetical protein